VPEQDVDAEATQDHVVPSQVLFVDARNQHVRQTVDSDHHIACTRGNDRPAKDQVAARICWQQRRATLNMIEHHMLTDCLTSRAQRRFSLSSITPG
jgi:hypothetical protein